MVDSSTKFSCESFLLNPKELESAGRSIDLYAGTNLQRSQMIEIIHWHRVKEIATLYLSQFEINQFRQFTAIL